MHFINIILGSLIGLAAAQPTTVNSYAGEKVIQLMVRPKITGLVDKMGVWSLNSTTNVSPAQLDQLNATNRWPMNYTTLVDNVSKLIKGANLSRLKAAKYANWFASYHNYNNLVSWYSNLTKANPKAVCFVPSIGKMVEGQYMADVHITNPKSTVVKRKI